MEAQVSGWGWEFWPRNKKRWPKESRGKWWSTWISVSLQKVGRTAWTLQGIWGLNKGVPNIGRPWRKGLDMMVEALVPDFTVAE